MGRTTRRFFLTQAGAGMALSGCRFGGASPGLPVFDTIWRTVRDQYFDPAFGGLDWRAIRREWRPKAAAAASQAELYLDVLFPVLDQFDASHVVLTPPRDLILSNGRLFRLPRQQKGRPIFMIAPEDEAGMGAVLTWTGAAYVVEDVSVASPAHSAGLSPGQSVRFAGLRGGPDERRELQLVGDDRRFSVSWTRKVAAPPRESKPLKDGATYLRFNEFDGGSVSWATGALLGSPGPIVLDLRRNGGGLIRDCWRFLSAIVPPHSDLGRFRGRAQDYPMSSGAGLDRFSGGLAVLIGPRTASAAEVTAAALQHHGRARLFGARTSGSLLLSQIHDLPDGGKLMLPYADYLSPAGARIEDRGVAPDVSVPRTAASIEAGSDPAVDAAVDWLVDEA